MNTTTVSHDPMQLLAQADLLMLLAELLRDPAAEAPGDDLPPLLQAASLDDDGDLDGAWLNLAQALRQSDANQRDIEHHRLFEGALACPPNQTAYVRRDKGVILGDVCAFYRAFHLEARPGGEKPDHIVTELEYLALLLVMTAQASARDQEDARQVAADAARGFADDHLAPWLGLFSGQLRRAAWLPAYHRLADTLDATWAALARYHGWASLEQPPTADSDPLPIDLEPPSDECGAIADPVVPLQVRGNPLP